MKKRVVVLSLGGSLIIPNEVDSRFLKKFKKIILKNSKEYKFVIICGGGSIARKYIRGLKNAGSKTQSIIGAMATRTNARFVSLFFGQDYPNKIPTEIEEIKKQIKKQDIVICGALKFKRNQTTDSTAAEVAVHFKTDFINLTDVKGLHDKNPKKHKNARLIRRISWMDFDKMAKKSRFEPGQHFVLDQSASEIIMKNKTRTYILGRNLKYLNNLLKGKKFIGTLIQG